MDAFRLQWNNYKDSDRKFQRNESCMQQHLYEHFYSEGHNGFLGNVFINLIDKTDGFQPKKRENYWMRTLKTLAPLGLDAFWCCQIFYILDTCFCTTILDWTVFVLRTLGTILTLYLFCLYITPVITVSASFGGFLINVLCELIDWSLCDLVTLIEVYGPYLIYVCLFILFIYLFALCYIYFCLLILSVLFFVVVVVAYSFFNSFHCSCSGFSMYFTFLLVISTLLFMLSLCIRTFYPCYYYFVFISVLI